MTFENYKFYLYYIYTIAFFIALIVAMEKDIKNRDISNKFNVGAVFVFCIIFILLFGNRSVLVGTDTGTMIKLFNKFPRVEEREPFLNLLIEILHKFTDAQGYLFFLAILYLGNIFLLIKNQGATVNKYLFFFFFICMSFFEPMGINVVRQGVSLLFFLNAVNYFNRKQWKISLLFVLLSFTFHSTAIIAIALFLISIFLSKRSFFISGSVFVLAAGFAISNVNVFDFLPKEMGIEAFDVRTRGYITKETYGYTVGFRPTFFLYNLFFLVVGIYVLRYVKAYGDPLYYKRMKIYLNYFLLSSAVFFLAFSLPFSDRWGLFSWIIIPFFFQPFFSRGGKRFAVTSVFFSAAIFILFQFFIG